MKNHGFKVGHIPCQRDHFCEKYLSENQKNRMYGYHSRHCRAVREESAVVSVMAGSTTGAQFLQKIRLPKLGVSEFCLILIDFHQKT